MQIGVSADRGVCGWLGGVNKVSVWIWGGG